MSQMNWTRNAILALVLAGLGTLAYWLEFKKKPMTERAEELSKAVFPIKEVPIVSIRLVNGAKVFSFRCKDADKNLCKSGDQSEWEITEPSRNEGDRSNLNSLLSTLANLSASETLDLSGDSEEKRVALLQEYGFHSGITHDRNFRRVEITAADGKMWTAFFGSSHPVDERIFTVVAEGEKLQNNRVFLVQPYFRTQFDHDLTYWRNKKIFGHHPHEIQAMRYRSTKGQVRVERHEGQWRMTSPAIGADPIAGDIENVDSLIAALNAISAKAFVSESLKEPAARQILSAGKELIRFDIEKPGPLVVRFISGSGKNANKLYAAVSNRDPLFEVDSGLKERLTKAPNELRLQKLITSLERFTFKRMEFAGNPIGGTLLLESKDGTWKQGDREVNQERAKSVLERMSGNKIQEFLIGAKYPSGESEGLRVTLGEEAAPKKREFLFWKKGEKLYARDLASKRKEALLVDKGVADALPWKKDHFENMSSPSESAKSTTESTNSNDHHGHDGHDH